MAEERDEKKINPGGPEEPSREDEIGTDQGTSSGSEQTEDTKRGETEKKKNRTPLNRLERPGRKCSSRRRRRCRFLSGSDCY